MSAALSDKPIQLTHTQNLEMYKICFGCIQVVVIALRDTVSYLMGSPADLKLNGPLNNVLGRFFLFHIDLWWAFLGK